MRAQRLAAWTARWIAFAACGEPSSEHAPGGAAALGAPAAEATSRADAGETAPARLPDAVRPTRYALALRIDPAQTQFSGEVPIDVTLAEPTSHIWLHGQNLLVSAASVQAGGQTIPARWQVADASEGSASLQTASLVPAGPATLRIAYTAPFDPALEGLYRVGSGEEPGGGVTQRGIRRYLRQHARGNATTAERVAALSAQSGRDVGAVLDDLTLRPGIPLLQISLACEAGQAPRVDFAQSRYRPLGSRAGAQGFWHVPVCVRWSAAGALKTSCTLLESAPLELEGTSCPDWILPNADGGSYARFSLPEAQLAALGAALARPGDAAAGAPAAGPLTACDQIALAGSVTASFQAGRIPFRAALELLAPRANNPERFVASAPIALLARARDHDPEPAQLPAFRAYGRGLYAAQRARLGWSGPQDEDGEVRPEAVGADSAAIALSVAAQEGGAASFENLLAALGATEDSEVRANLLAGRAAIDDDALRPRVLELTLDRRLRLNEASGPLSGQLGARGGNAQAWQWLTEHDDAVRARLGPENAGSLPLAASAFCSPEHAAELRAFFEPRMADTDGGPRHLASAIETIELCSALAAAQAEDARAFFAARAE